MTDSFPCANCGQDSSCQRMSVPVCDRCAVIVDRKKELLERQLDAMRVIFDEHLRLQLIQARLPKEPHGSDS